jgi:hypothetical protein
MYRRIRQKVKDAAIHLRSEGVERVRLLGEGDVADICRLTCLEQGLAIVDDPALPTFEVRGLSVALVYPKAGDFEVQRLQALEEHGEEND